MDRLEKLALKSPKTIMTYYESLLKHVGKSMKDHPQSTVVMDYGTLKVLATGTNTEKISKKLSRSRTKAGIPVVFQRPSDKAVWVL